MSLVELLETTKFDEECCVFTIDFKRLCTNIPIEDAINYIKEVVMEFDNVIQNADFFIIEILNVILKNSLMTFNGEYVQQIFGVIMGTNAVPILANIGKLEKLLKDKCKTDKKN